MKRLAIILLLLACSSESDSIDGNVSTLTEALSNASFVGSCSTSSCQFSVVAPDFSTASAVGILSNGRLILDDRVKIVTLGG
jgi:hypothetical protein